MQRVTREFNIRVRKLRFRKENRVGFDSDDFIRIVTSDEALLRLLKEWKDTTKKTRFFVSTKVIGEAIGIITNVFGWDSTDAREKIKKIMKLLDIKPLKYDKRIDNKPGYELLCKYKQEKNGSLVIDEHINDGRIIAHYNRKKINIVYSEEKLVRDLAEMVGMEGRRLF